MQFKISSIFAVAPLLLAASVSAIGCFSDGADLQGADPTSAIDAACNTLVGNYIAGSTQNACQGTGNGNKIDFVVANTFDHSEVLTKDHCVSNMGITAQGCKYGGIRATGLFEMTLDINSGPC